MDVCAPRHSVTSRFPDSESFTFLWRLLLLRLPLAPFLSFEICWTEIFDIEILSHTKLHGDKNVSYSVENSISENRITITTQAAYRREPEPNQIFLISFSFFLRRTDWDSVAGLDIEFQL